MAEPVRSWWRARRVKHRDAVALCVLASSFFLAGELTNPALDDIYLVYLAPFVDRPFLFALRAVLAGLAFTTAFGAVLVLVGGWNFMRGRIGRGRLLVGLGIGMTSLSLAARLAYATLEHGSPLTFLLPLTTSLTGFGILFGVSAHIVMGQYALLVKKHARRTWRRWRRSKRVERREARRARNRRLRT